MGSGEAVKASSRFAACAGSPAVLDSEGAARGAILETIQVPVKLYIRQKMVFAESGRGLFDSADQSSVVRVIVSGWRVRQPHVFS